MSEVNYTIFYPVNSRYLSKTLYMIFLSICKNTSMKKIIYSLLCSVSLLLAGCASAPKTQKSTPDSKYLNITSTFAIQLEDTNYSAAYGRMNESYKQIYTESEFVQSCSNFFSDIADTSAYKTNFCKDQGNFYIYTEICYDKNEDSKVLTLAFNPTSGLPVQILFHRYTAQEDTRLKALAEKNFKIGCGMTGYNSQTYSLRLPKYMELAETHFSSTTSTNLMKPSAVLNQQKSMKNFSEGNPAPALDFSNVTPLLRWAQANNVQVRGHTLVWHTQVPAWFFHEGYKNDSPLVSRETMIQRTDSYIQQYLSYCQDNFPGVVYCWDVVNEAVDPGAGDKSSYFMCRTKLNNEDNLWYTTIGNDYPEIAFTIARKYAAPDVKLFYNDYGTTDTIKRNYIYKLCKNLAEKGLIDGIGMQSYWDMNTPPLKTIASTIDYYAELGLEIQLTEWSMPVKEENDSSFQIQAERYASIFRLLQKLDQDNGGPANITCVSSFGVVDHYPLYSSDTNNTRFWTGDYKPKPAFFAIQDTLGFN